MEYPQKSSNLGWLFEKPRFILKVVWRLECLYSDASENSWQCKAKTWSSEDAYVLINMLQVLFNYDPYFFPLTWKNFCLIFWNTQFHFKFTILSTGPFSLIRVDSFNFWHHITGFFFGVLILNIFLIKKLIASIKGLISRHCSYSETAL